MITIKKNFIALDAWLTNVMQKSGVFCFRIVQFFLKYLSLEDTREVLIVLREDLSWEMVMVSDLDVSDLESIILLELFSFKEKEISAIKRFFETENTAFLSLEVFKKLHFLIERKGEHKEWIASQKRRYELSTL